MIFRFASFEFDEDRLELRRGGEVIALQPRALRLLKLLVKSENRLVTKAHIREIIWEGRHVSQNALTSQIVAVRKALDDRRKPHRIVETVHGEGFRFVPEVVTDRGAASSISSAPDMTAKRGSAPRIAVLPFQDAKAGKDGSPIGQFIAAEIIGQLVHLTGVEVLSRNTTFPNASEIAQDGRRARELRVDYLLVGIIEAREIDLLLRVELSETSGNTVLWSEAFDFPREDADILHREIVSEVTHRVGARITQREAELARVKRSGDLTAWNRFHLGMSAIYGRMIPEYQQSLAHLSEALAISPDFAPAHACASRAQIFRVFYGSDTDVAAALADAVSAGRTATTLDPHNSFASLSYAHALRMSGELDEACLWSDRAVEIAPNFADAQASAAAVDLWTGKYFSSLAHAERAQALDPWNPIGFENQIHMALAALHLGKSDTAHSVARDLESNPVTFTNSLPLGAALTVFHHTGARDDAARVAEKIVQRGFHRQRLPISVLFGNRAEDTVALVADAVAAHVAGRAGEGGDRP